MLTAEQETTITYDSEEKLVRIFSARVADQGKLRRAGISPKKGSQAFGFFYEIPLTRLRWRVTTLGNPRPKRVLPPGHAFLRKSLHRKGIPDGNT